MQRITITVDDDLMDGPTGSSRSAATRTVPRPSDLARAGLQQATLNVAAVAIALRPWSMSDHRRATWPSGSCIRFTSITNCHSRRFICISITTAAWR
jgi:hypothetical protein